MRRQPVAFCLMDVGFLSDGKFRKLARRLPDPDDFNSAVGAYFVALAASRRNGLPTLDVPAETESSHIDVLRAVGLLDEHGFPPKAWTAWSAMSPQQAAGGLARAEQAARDAGGRFASNTSVTSALDTAGHAGFSGPALPSPPFPSTPVVVSHESTKKTTSRVSSERARDGSAILLTKAQLDGWESFKEDCWLPFKEAWLGRRLLFPPFGQPDDDPGTSQRSRLFRIADARPEWLGRVVREAPGKTAHDVIDHIFGKWAEIEQEVGTEEDEAVAAQAEYRRDRRPMESVRAILPRVVGPAA